MRETKVRNRWKRYKFFRILGGISIITSLATIVLLAAFINEKSESIWRDILISAFVISISVFIVSVIYTTLWSCPKCGKNFTIRSIGPFKSNWPVFNNCGRCGFKPEKIDLRIGDHI